MPVSPAETVPQTPPRAAPRWRPLAPYLLTAVLAVIARLPTLNNNPIFIDELVYFIQGQRINTWERFVYAFQYRIETKLQISNLPYMLAQTISYDNAILIVRLFGVVAIIASVWLMISLSRRLFQSDFPGFFAIALWLVFLIRDIDTAATLLEYFQAPVLLLCVRLFIVALDDAAHPRLFALASGLALALAALIKPPALVIAPIMALALLFVPKLAQRRIRRARLIDGIVFGLGVSGPIILAIIPYFLRPGALADLVFGMYTLSIQYAAINPQNVFERVAGLLSRLNVETQIAFIAALGLWLDSFIIDARIVPDRTLLRAVRLRIGRRHWRGRPDTYQTVLVLVSLGLLIGYAAGLNEAHYLIPILPFLMLFVGYQLLILYRALAAYRRATVRIGWGLLLLTLLFETPAIINYVVLFGDDGKAYAAQTAGIAMPTLTAYIDAHTKPTDAIWVYYNAPEVYLFAHRTPATKDPSAAALAYFNTPFWYTEMAHELDADKPALIADLHGVARYVSLPPPPLTRTPVVRDLLARDYTCDSASVANVTLCLRTTP